MVAALRCPPAYIAGLPCLPTHPQQVVKVRAESMSEAAQQGKPHGMLSGTAAWLAACLGWPGGGETGASQSIGSHAGVRGLLDHRNGVHEQLQSQTPPPINPPMLLCYRSGGPG